MEISYIVVIFVIVTSVINIFGVGMMIVAVSDISRSSDVSPLLKIINNINDHLEDIRFKIRMKPYAPVVCPKTDEEREEYVFRYIYRLQVRNNDNPLARHKLAAFHITHAVAGEKGKLEDVIKFVNRLINKERVRAIKDEKGNDKWYAVINTKTEDKV